MLKKRLICMQNVKVCGGKASLLVFPVFPVLELELGDKMTKF